MTPRFKDIPDHWKQPQGPYRQAPPEYGGEWWLVNPFTTAEPWRQQEAPAAEKLPEGFEEIFGLRPQSSDFHGFPNPSRTFRTAVVEWERDLRHFKQAGKPEWASAEKLKAAAGVFRRWGMGEPRYYEGRYGWMARFSESEIPDFETAAWGAINVSHLTVAHYQIRLVDRGIVPELRHPFVPPNVWPRRGSKEEVA